MLIKDSSAAFSPEEMIDSLMMRGYLGARYHLVKEDSLSTFHFILGNRFVWGDVYYNELATSDLKQYLSKLKGSTADRFVLKAYIDKYLNHYFHNQGYPFATAELQFLEIDSSKVYASLQINQKNLITYDSILIKDYFLDKDYLQAYLNLKAGNNWSSKDFALINERLSDLGIASLHSPPEVKFEKGKAIIQLNLLDKVQNRFDAIIGIIPEGSKTYITGQADLLLENLFKSAIESELKWRKYSNNSQFLTFDISQQKAFKSPLGFDVGTKILKEDSSFISVNFNLFLNFMPWPKWYLFSGYQKEINTVSNIENTINTNSIFRNSELNKLVIGIHYKKASRYPLLISDANAEFRFDIGRKKIINYEALPANLQNVPEKSLNYQVFLKLNFQQKIGSRFLVQQTITSNQLINKALSKNELLRLGGLNSFRGFDQNFFFEKSYQLLNINYRYFLNNKSNVFLLTDLAKLTDHSDWAYSFGLGLDAKTKNGWFSIIYALGAINEEKLNFSSAKVHFGYIAVF